MLILAASELEPYTGALRFTFTVTVSGHDHMLKSKSFFSSFFLRNFCPLPPKKNIYIYIFWLSIYSAHLKTNILALQAL